MIADAATLAAANRRSLAIAQGWRGGEPLGFIEDAFAQADPDDADAVGDIAEQVLRNCSWVGAMLVPLVAALVADPWFEPPLKVSRDPLRTGAILYEGSAATVSAVVLSADTLATMPRPETVVASGRLAVVRYVRSGSARLRRWRIERDATVAGECAPITLTDGAVVRQDGRDHAYLIEDARDDVATVTITTRAGMSGFAREYRRSDGVLVKRAALDDAPARSAMLLALLRLAGRSDAAASFDRATRDDAFFLRWQAMREWLALDVAAASPRLAEMALHDPNDEIRAAARTTQRLVEQQWAERCPA